MGIIAQPLSLLTFCKFLMWWMLTYYLVCPDDDCFHLDHGHFHHRKGWWKSRSKVPSTTCDCWCPEHPLLEASYLECSNIFPFRIFPICFQSLHFYCLYSMQLLWWSSPVCSSSVCSMHCYTTIPVMAIVILPIYTHSSYWFWVAGLWVLLNCDVCSLGCFGHCI